MSCFCFIVSAKAVPCGDQTLEAMIQRISFIFLLMILNFRASPGTHKKEKFYVMYLISDYFFDLNDFPWNSDAGNKEWVCSNVTQSYCDEESRNKIKI